MVSREMGRGSWQGEWMRMKWRAPDPIPKTSPMSWGAQHCQEGGSHLGGEADVLFLNILLGAHGHWREGTT